MARFWTQIEAPDTNMWIKVYTEAQNSWVATESFKAMYGSRMKLPYAVPETVTESQQSIAKETDYWAHVRVDNGSYMKVIISAPDQWTALSMFRALYGDRLISGASSV